LPTETAALAYFKLSIYFVRLQALTATSIKMAVFWNAALCGMVELTDVSEVFGGGIMGTRTSETSINIYQYTRRNIPAESLLHRHGKLKSHMS
jgi:hypothetical protein